MINEKKIRLIKFFKIACPILFFVDLGLGIFLLFNDINWWHLKWLWIIEGTLISLSLIASIYRIIITRGEYKKQFDVGLPIFCLIMFLGGAFIYAGIASYIYHKNNVYQKRMYEIQEELLRKKNDVEVCFGNVCREEHNENMDFVVEMVSSMNFKEVGYGEKECIRENVLFNIEEISYDYHLSLTFYRETSWIHYSLMDGDIFPHTESFYIKCDNVEIETLYNYIVENHEEFHKIEENKNGEE